jgi:GNAT superfamily N-acetyltransferase
MKLTQKHPSDFYDRAFCLSSVRLWCDSTTDSVRELAVSADEDGQTVAEALCLIRSDSAKMRVWLPYLFAAPGDSTPLRTLFEWTRRQMGLTSMEVKGFAELGTPASELLTQLGWSIERNFPVQVHWDNLGVSPDGSETLPSGVEIDVHPSEDEVARLFVDAFIDEWHWYFEQMDDRQRLSTRPNLLDLAKHYVAGANGYFVARIEGRGLGLSSLVLQSDKKHAVFHTGVGVVPDGRGRGLGKILTDFTLGWAKSHGMNSAEVRTQERPGTRNRNVEMYQSCGGSCGRAFGMFSGSIR